MADLGPGTMPRGKYPESPARAGSHALISRTPTPGGMLHANLGLPRPPPRNFQPPLRQQPPKQTQQRRHNVPPVQSLRDSAAATPVGCAAWQTTSSFRNFPRGWPPSWNDAARKISGISRASGLPRPYFQNADPGRHAPCQSRAATTSPSQLSTSPSATTSKTNPTAPPQCPSRAVASRQRSRNAGGMRRLANNIVIPEFSAWLTLVLEQCRAENIRNLPRQRAPTPLFPERRPREACSMPISGCHDLPLATFNLPFRNNLQNKPNSAATMSLPCSRFPIWRRKSGRNSWTDERNRNWRTSRTGHGSDQRLHFMIDADDNLLVVEMTGNYAGWLPKKAGEWLRKYTST